MTSGFSRAGSDVSRPAGGTGTAAACQGGCPLACPEIDSRMITQKGAVVLNKLERVSRALRGEAVDRPPFSFWYHFGLQHLPGRHHAEAEIDCSRAYDLDFVKVMSDYPYPLPPGLSSVLTAEDWRRVEPVDGSADCWDEQLSALSIIKESIGGEAMFIETVFSPWTTARRMSRSGGLRDAMQEAPEQLLAAMDAIATSLAAYA